MDEIVGLGERYVMKTYSRFPIVIERGEGVYMYDTNGKKYLDFVAGIAVNTFGCGDKEFEDALISQIKLFNHCSNYYWTKPMIETARLLVENSCFSKVFFCNSGAEATESALKLVKKYSVKYGKPKIIAMNKSFHGRTLGSLSITGQRAKQQDFEPLLPNIQFADFNDIESVRKLMSGSTAGVFLEPIQGEGGLIAAKKEFLQELRALCDKFGSLLVFDEVQCGMGRTGTLFAYQHYGVEPDVVCLAKGLANGFPIGAMLARAEAENILTAGDHASTFGGNPLATTCARVVLNRLLDGKFLKNVQRVSEYFKNKLTALKKYPVVKELRGDGLMLGLALNKPAKEIVNKCVENGLLIGAVGGDVLRFVPPLILEEQHVDEGIRILEGVLQS